MDISGFSHSQRTGKVLVFTCLMVLLSSFISSEISNSPPIIEDIEDITVYEGELVELTVDAHDNDLDTISYSINPSIFTQFGNTFSWQTTLLDAGTYIFTVEVADEESFSLREFRLTVLESPSLDVTVEKPINSLSLFEEEYLTISVTCNNPGGCRNINLTLLANNGDEDVPTWVIPYGGKDALSALIPNPVRLSYMAYEETQTIRWLVIANSQELDEISLSLDYSLECQDSLTAFTQSFNLQQIQTTTSTTTSTTVPDGVNVIKYTDFITDSMVSSQEPDTILGESTNLYIGNIDSNSMRSLLHIDLPNNPGDIIGATLSLYCFTSAGHPQYTNSQLGLYELEKDFNPTQVTWNQRREGKDWNTAGTNHKTKPISVTSTGLSECTGEWMNWTLMGEETLNPLNVAWEDNLNLLIRAVDEQPMFSRSDLFTSTKISDPELKPRLYLKVKRN